MLGQLFVPGHALAGEREGRASSVIAHVLGLSDVEVAAALDEIVERFGGRHRGSVGDVRPPRRTPRQPAPGRRRAVRAAPAAARRDVHPGASRWRRPPCATRVRCRQPIRPGSRPASCAPCSACARSARDTDRRSASARSSSGPTARSRSIDAVRTRPPARSRMSSSTSRCSGDCATDVDAEAIRWVLDGLGPRFTDAASCATQLHAARGPAGHATRRVAARRRGLLERAARCYARPVPESGVRRSTSACSSRRAPPSRTVSRTPASCASSTTTTPPRTTRPTPPSTARRSPSSSSPPTDFESFTSFPLLGAGAANKGLALFPRRIGGRYHALSRCDGERNALAVSDDLRHWPTATPLDVIDQTWSSVQLGNCGSPIELDEGWLVLTHGVGAMRTYSIGALLLDIDDPSSSSARPRDRSSRRGPDDQDGYVPNVVYSCGALRHGDHLVVPSASPTAGSGSPRSPSPPSSPPCATAPTAHDRQTQEVTDHA